MLFCTLIILSTIGNSLGTRSSFAQVQQVKSQIPSTISMHPVNTTQTKSAQSQNTISSTTQNKSGDPTTKTLTQSFTSNKTPMLTHTFQSIKAVGPDRFRFIRSFWTSSQTGNPFNSFATCPPFAPNLEVDTGEGYATLAVVLQYQGVVHLEGITAALKLPSGFEAQLPLADNRNNYDIALSNFNNKIDPSQAVVLCFPINVLPNAVPRLPVLGPLALHFLRNDTRTMSDTLNMKQEDIFSHVFSAMQLPNSTSLTKKQDIITNYMNSMSRAIPFDFINQVIPIVFQATGRAVLDVTLPYPNPAGIRLDRHGYAITPAGSSVQPYTNGIVPTAPTIAGPTSENKIPASNTLTQAVVPMLITPTKIAFTNRGTAPLYDLVVTVQVGTSAFASIAASFTYYPTAIVGQQTFHLFAIPPHVTKIITVYLSAQPYACAVLTPLSITSEFSNSVGVQQVALQTPLPVQLVGSCPPQINGINAGSPAIGGTLPAPGPPVPRK
jgi:hypothetical protein